MPRAKRVIYERGTTPKQARARAPRPAATPPNGAHAYWSKRLDVTWKSIVAVVGIVSLIQYGLSYLGEKRTTPAQAVEKIAQNVALLTVQLHETDSAAKARSARSDSISQERQTAVEKSLLQNQYSICIIAKRPQSECADIIFSGGARR